LPIVRTLFGFLELLYPGRPLVLDSPLSAEDLTRRLEAAFEGTCVDGRLRVMRRVRGTNSFRPLVEGHLRRAPRGSRLDVRLRLHPVVLAFGAVFATGAGLAAAVAAPEIPMAAGSPLLALVLAMAAVAFLFALLGAIEARTSTRLLATLAQATPAPPAAAPRLV
jgi:VIT1/CCC1 family predicted Fe2+/Mn2+ transporter